MTIKKFKHKGLKKFFESGIKSGIQTVHTNKIALILDLLDAAKEAKDMNFPGSNFHSLRGDLRGLFSVHVNGNWTIIFRFEKGDAYDVNLIDYH